MKQLKSSEMNALRERLHKEQNGICPLIKKAFPAEDMVIDHQHKDRMAQEPGENGAGLIRGCIHRMANIIEGKIWNSWKRTAMNQHDIPLPDFLRNLADYLERDNLPLIHPSEKLKEPILKKSSYNQLVKQLKADGYTKKIPPYRMSKGKTKKPAQKMTKPLQKLFEDTGIEPEFY